MPTGKNLNRPFLILLATIGTLTSYACRCNLLTFSEEVIQADQIFIGTVLNKTTADKAYYLFTVSEIFKGDSDDTLTIKTGFDGPDCGMVFEVGKTYLVYSHNKQTTWCRRNAPANDNEAEYLNAELTKLRKDFNFQEKKVAFVLSGSFIDKQQYFKNWGGKEVVNNLIILTDEEKQIANGYDGIIVSWRKQGVSKSFRKRLIKRLT